MSLFNFDQFRPISTNFSQFWPILAGRPVKIHFGRLFSNPGWSSAPGQGDFKLVSGAQLGSGEGGGGGGDARSALGPAQLSPARTQIRNYRFCISLLALA